MYVLKRERHDLIHMCKNLNSHDKVYLARHKKRPKITEYVDAIFDDFFEQKGDALGKEDASIYGGIATYHGIPVTVIGHRKGNDLAENLKCNFGMPGPEGYRKALRLMKQAEKFGRPIITFIDTPGAYPGLEAEMYGQGRAIAINLAKMSDLKVPVIAIVTGEGSSRRCTCHRCCKHCADAGEFRVFHSFTGGLCFHTVEGCSQGARRPAS